MTVATNRKDKSLSPDAQAVIQALSSMTAAMGVKNQGGWGFGNPYSKSPLAYRAGGTGADDIDPSGTSYIYGQGLFSLCGDNDVISLLVRDEALIRWLNWRPNNEVLRPVKMLTWVGPEGTSESDVTAGWLGDDCDVPNSVEWGKCEINFSKGLMGRCGQDISALQLGKKYCEQEPTYRIDGSVVDNDAEWQAALAAMVLRDDVSELLITGNSATAGQFDGLEQIITDGYVDFRTSQVCPQVDSIIYDWNNAGVSGISSLIAEIVARIRRRARGVGGVNPADMVIMLPSFLRDCLVDEYACDQPCGTGSAGNPITVVAFDARDNRDQYLVGGQFGDGFIPVNGTPISFLVNDWIPFASGPGPNYCSDIYILTRQVGPRQVIFGEFQDLNVSAAELNKQFGGGYRITDGGKFLVYARALETCFNTCILTKPGLIISAPWAQARITNVCCGGDNALPPLSPNPDSSYFLAYGDLYQATPPGAITT